jgi:predicted dehydrogenase/nucleoside-diphosphate-sugar epimerase
MRRVVLVGAGAIAQIHAEILRNIPNVELHGVIDRRDSAANALAAKWSISRVFGSTGEAVRSGEVDCAHVLTPPDTHAAAAQPFLEAGIPTLIEKPLAADHAECEMLQAAAGKSKIVLGVNQNFVHHPAFVRLRRVVEERQLGGLRFVSCLYNVPLRQLTARQFGHWMFEKPVNILLEQAVHPLSQVVVLAGPVEETLSMAGLPIDTFPGVPFHASFGLTVRCGRSQAEVRLAVGQSFPFWQITAICDDGVAVADIAYNRFFTYERTRWLESCDNLLSGAATAAAILRDSLCNAAQYVLSTAKIASRNDPFFQSMRGSIAAFHQALDRDVSPELDGAFGAHLVAVCEEATRGVPDLRRKPASVATSGQYDVLVLGGTGFIGRYVVERLLANGYRVGVMARNPRNLGTPFDNERVVLLQGDARSDADVDHAIGAARIVVNLAHGGGQGSYSEVRAAMVGAAEVVARACLTRRVERLVHAGSIAALYLGPQDRPVTGSTLPDPQAHRRADYARAKAECDRMLLELHATQGLPVCILRPGVVIGDGGVATHGALGLFNNEQHCIGWNAGRNPLPFVLVEDVADAICLACKAPGVVGHSYNLVGDVRLTAREYIAELAQVLRRPIRFHPKSPNILWLQELGKWLVKMATGRRAPVPTRRDLLSRGLAATFDCSDAARDLGWRPTGDRARFIERGIRIHTQRLLCG